MASSKPNASTALSSSSVPFDLCMHDFIIMVYPMVAFKVSFHKKKPTLYAAIVLSIFAFMAAVFILYDFLVG